MNYNEYVEEYVDETTQVGFITSPEVARITDASNNKTLSTEFLSWTELGFVLNVVTISGDKQLRFVCHP